MNDAREEILNRIRSVNRGVTAETRAPEYAGIERLYRQANSLSRVEVIECFIDRLRDYGSGVHRCVQRSISKTVASILEQRGIAEMFVSSGVPVAWRPPGISFVEDEACTYGALDAGRGTLTSCAAAIALTGTIILNHTRERRALTLIPDYHLCVVFEDQVAETVPEAIRQIAGLGNAPVTTIAGPSATADIEMTRIQGVHGPRILDVILAGR